MGKVSNDFFPETAKRIPSPKLEDISGHQNLRILHAVTEKKVVSRFSEILI